MKKVSFFGGSGGLGQKITPILKEKYIVDVVSSKDVDITDYNQVKSYFEKNNDIDVVIFFSNYNYNSLLHKYTGDNIDNLKKQIDVNINGLNYVLSECLKNMRIRNFGRIILASSVTVDKKIIGTSIYSACKSYYENISKSICIENANKNITSNVIQLGYMDGGLLYTLPEDLLIKIKNEIPSKKFGDTNNISDTIDFIIQNDYINGTTIKLTGGL
jgi:NAD(P)-dependent dehydrogenase (short-subunit alcohol dehydrogenase family)